MGFRIGVNLPPYPNIKSLGPINPHDFVAQQVNGATLGVAGRLYLSRFYNPQRKTVRAIGVVAGAAGSVDLGVYQGEASSGLTLVGHTGSVVTGAGTTTSRFALATPFAIPASGSLFFAWGNVGATGLLTFGAIDGTGGFGIQYVAGLLYYADGLLGGGVLPASIAAGAVTDISTLTGVNRIRHLGAIGTFADLELV